MANNNIKPLQLFNPKMIELGQKMTPEQIVRFLDEFRQKHGDPNQHANLYSSEFQEKMLLAIIHS